MEYSTPIDTIITKTINCMSPYHNIILQDLSNIIKTYDIKIIIKYYTNNTNSNSRVIFTIEGYQLNVLDANIYILELIKLSMEIEKKTPSNNISLNISSIKKQPIKLRANESGFNKHKQLDNKITQLDNKITQLDNKITQLDNKITQLDNKHKQSDNPQYNEAFIY
uniref:Uncharacterized protein n=1 Tax=viral metagenome TaxID=1070528 RepID=A0A6C0JB93_9ZZZZ